MTDLEEAGSDVLAEKRAEQTDLRQELVRQLVSQLVGRCQVPVAASIGLARSLLAGRPTRWQRLRTAGSAQPLAERGRQRGEHHRKSLQRQFIEVSKASAWSSFTAHGLASGVIASRGPRAARYCKTLESRMSATPNPRRSTSGHERGSDALVVVDFDILTLAHDIAGAA
jgi:hypothetical protein